MLLSILQAGINQCVLVNSGDLNSKLKIIATSDKVLNIQNSEGTTLYDALDLSFNKIDKTSSLS